MARKQGSESPFQVSLSRYLQELELAKGRSPGTIENYRSKLVEISQLFKGKAPEAVTADDVWNLRVVLNERKLSRRTQGYYLIAIRGFLRFLQREGRAVLDPSLIELPKVPERKIEALEDGELQRLVAATSGSSLKTLRDRAILETLFSTGLRVSELCGLNRDLDLERGEVTVRGKGDRLRLVFISPAARQAIGHYLEARDKVLPPGQNLERALFVSLSKNQSPQRLTSRGVQKLLAFYGRKAGLLRQVHPHMLRHQFGTDLLRAGADLRSVQLLLGHKHLTTTQLYTHLTDKELHEIHRSFHGRRRGK